MNLTKITIAVVIGVIALASCQHKYNCHCEMRPKAQPITNWVTDYEVKGNNEGKAAAKCDAYDNDIRDCSIQ